MEPFEQKTDYVCLLSDATCLEGALKIKEVSYMHSEGVRIPFSRDPSQTLISVVLPFRFWPVNSSTVPWHSLTNISRE